MSRNKPNNAKKGLVVELNNKNYTVYVYDKLSV